MSKEAGQLSADDSVEIEIVPPRPKRVRSRTPNPAVDDVIQSGEITTEPRSHIVRRSSANMLRVEIDEDATELTRIPTLPPAPPRKIRWMWLIAAVAPAVAAVVLTFADRPARAATAVPQSPAKLQPAAVMIGTAFDGSARAVRMRAEAIASTPMLKAGVETDAATLADMARDKDLVFQVERGEVLEVFQLRDGARTLMLRMPANAPALKSPGSGKASIEARGEGVAVIAAVPIQQGKSKLVGEVVIGVPVDLEPIKKQLAELGGAASITGLGAPIVLVAGDATGASVSAPIETKVSSASLALVVNPATVAASLGSAGSMRMLRYVCAGLAGLLVLIYFASMLRPGRRAPTSV